MIMMMNCFCGMFDRQKVFSLISSWDHCQRSSPSRISDTPRAGFEPVQNLSSDFVEWSCAVVITTTQQHHMPRYTKKFVELHVPFVFFRLKKMHVNFSSLTNTCKSIRLKINTQQLEEHDPGMIKESLHCTTLYVTSAFTATVKPVQMTTSIRQPLV